MADAFVFHLMRPNATGLLRQYLVLRYTYDDRILVQEGDVWRRIATDGEVTNYRVASLRMFQGEHDKEIHAFMEPVYELVAR